MDESMVQCPICLNTIILPITLACGHSYCQPCIKHAHFQHVKKACPVCRSKIELSVQDHNINIILDQILRSYLGGNQKYMQRIYSVQKQKFENKAGRYWEILIKKLKQHYPWIIIALLLYHLIRIKINVFNLLFEKYKNKALKLAESIEKENSLDFKFLLFSQFMRMLFSNMIIH